MDRFKIDLDGNVVYDSTAPEERRPMISDLPEVHIVPTDEIIPEPFRYVPIPTNVPPRYRKTYDN